MRRRQEGKWSWERLPFEGDRGTQRNEDRRRYMEDINEMVRIMEDEAEWAGSLWSPATSNKHYIAVKVTALFNNIYFKYTPLFFNVTAAFSFLLSGGFCLIPFYIGILLGSMI